MASNVFRYRSNWDIVAYCSKRCRMLRSMMDMFRGKADDVGRTVPTRDAADARFGTRSECPHLHILATVRNIDGAKRFTAAQQNTATTECGRTRQRRHLGGATWAAREVCCSRYANRSGAGVHSIGVEHLYVDRPFRIVTRLVGCSNPYLIGTWLIKYVCRKRPTRLQSSSTSPKSARSNRAHRRS